MTIEGKLPKASGLQWRRARCLRHIALKGELLKASGFQ